MSSSVCQLPPHFSPASICLTVFSNPLRTLNLRFPHLHTLPDLIPNIPSRNVRPHTTLFTSKLRQHSAPRLILYETLPNIDGYMGI